MQNSLEHTDSMGEVNLGTLSVVTAQSIGVSKDSANTKKPLQRYKSKAHKVVVGLIISISAVMFGCSIRQITIVPTDTLISQYQIPLTVPSTQSILIGILPIGGCVGAILTTPLIKHYRRLTGIYIFTLINVFAIFLVNITQFPALIIGRFIEGICIGFYSSISPIYLHQISPKELRKLMGLFFSFGKCIGVLLVISLSLILTSVGVAISWRILLSTTAVLSLLQALLIFLFCSDTPVEMIEKGLYDRARQIISENYHEEYVEEVFQEYIKDYQEEIGKASIPEGDVRWEQHQNNYSLQLQPLGTPIKGNLFVNNLAQEQFNEDATKSKLHQTSSTNKNAETELPASTSSLLMGSSHPANKGNDQQPVNQGNKVVPSGSVLLSSKGVSASSRSLPAISTNKAQIFRKKRIAYLLCLQICLLRHFAGANVLITQIQNFIGTLNPTLGNYTTLAVNLVNFAAVVIGLMVVSQYFGKRALLLFSITALASLDIGIGLAMYFSQLQSLFTLVLVYMTVYGTSFVSPVWAYPSEIVPAAESLGPNIVHWIGMALSTLTPPLIAQAVGHTNMYPMFFFFGTYSFLGLVHVWWKMVDSDGYHYHQIIEKFR